MPTQNGIITTHELTTFALRKGLASIDSEKYEHLIAFESRDQELLAAPEHANGGVEPPCG